MPAGDRVPDALLPGLVAITLDGLGLNAPNPTNSTGRVGQSLEDKTQRQKGPHPPGSLAYAAMGLSDARRMDRLPRKARPEKQGN